MAIRGKYGKIILSNEDIEYIKTNFKSNTNKEIAEALGLKMTTVRTLAYGMGLKRMELQRWTPEQVDFLKANYQTIGNTEIAQIFKNTWAKKKGWHKKHIEKKLKQLQLKRSKAEINAIRQRNKLMGKWSNASKKMWLKRGETPIGKKKIWISSSGRMIVVIKTKKGFVHYNRWLWEKHKGSLPKGVNVCLKQNAHPTKYGINDLELLTNAQLASRNSKNRTPEVCKQTLNIIRQIEKVIYKTQ